MSWNNKRVLITGVTGFVGSYLAEALVEKGADVYGYMRGRSEDKLPESITRKNIEDKVTFIKGDLLDVYSIATSLDVSEPDVVFHLAAQSYVPRSFSNPLETYSNNTLGTVNLLETLRMKECDPKIVFAGSSEEYGLVVSSEKQYSQIKEKYGSIFPEPDSIPELPINEMNPLRPMSPYAVSKVHGDYAFRNYYSTYGLKTIVSRAFNHEGAGRGDNFVTSVITKQVMSIKKGLTSEINIGNVNAFRDWSHVKDIIDGYLLLSEKSSSGDVYNQGSSRLNSVISYILLSLEEAGYKIKEIETMDGNKHIKNPTELNDSETFGLRFNKTKVDDMIIEGELEYDIKDQGINVTLENNKKIKIKFIASRFRPSEVPYLLSDTTKIAKLGFKVKYSLKDIIRDQLNYYL